MKVNDKDINLYVRESLLAKFNLFWVFAILVIITIVLFIKSLILPGLVSGVICLVAYSYIRNFQKEFKYNLSLWDKFVPDDVLFFIDKNAGKIFLTGVEIAFCDVKEIKIDVAEQQPKLIGKTKQLFEKNFVNANIEIITSTKSHITPIQSKHAIRDLEEIFKDLNLNTVLDVKLYNI